MHLCYIDESGTPDVPGVTSHYVLAGLSIPDEYWKQHHQQLEAAKRRHSLDGAEIHVAWMMRPYVEQESIPGFVSMSYDKRRMEVHAKRKGRASPAARRSTASGASGLRRTTETPKPTST